MVTGGIRVISMGFGIVIGGFRKKMYNDILGEATNWLQHTKLRLYGWH
jgi:hypothetical protein